MLEHPNSLHCLRFYDMIVSGDHKKQYARYNNGQSAGKTLGF